MTAVVVSIASLAGLISFVAGPEYFLDLLSGSVWQIAVISAVAGIVRLPFQRGGIAFSVICGAGIALVGFLIVLAHAMSRI